MSLITWQRPACSTSWTLLPLMLLLRYCAIVCFTSSTAVMIQKVFLECDKSTSLWQKLKKKEKKEEGIIKLQLPYFLDNSQVAFGVDLDLQEDRSIFPKAIETCLKGMLYIARDIFYEVWLDYKFVRSLCGDDIINCLQSSNLAFPVQAEEPTIH